MRPLIHARTRSVRYRARPTRYPRPAATSPGSPTRWPQAAWRRGERRRTAVLRSRARDRSRRGTGPSLPSRPRRERPLFRGAARWGRGAGRRGAFAQLARRIDEVAEELGIGLEQHARIVGAHPRLVGLHRTVEREEVGVLAIGLRENAVTLAIALAAGLLAFRLRLGEQHGDLAIGLGADLLRALGALRAQLRRLLLTLGLHALINRLAVLLRPVGAADAYVDHSDAEGLRLCVELLAHLGHEVLALVAHDLRQRGLAQHAAQRRVEQGRQLQIRAVDSADGLVEFERLLDPVAGEGVDHQPLLVGGDHLLRRVFEVEDALVDADDAVDQRDLGMQSGLGDYPYRLAQPNHQRLPGLIDREQRAIGDDQRHDDEGGDDAAGEIEPHRPPPVCGAGVGARRMSWSSGR